MITSRWLADRPAGWHRRRRWHPRVRWLLASLAVLALAPAESNALWWKATPRAISSGTLARALPAGSTAISLPFWNPKDRSLYAQATSGMRFRLIDQWVQDIPLRYQPLMASINRLTELSAAPASRSGAARLERELSGAGIEYAIVWGTNDAATRLLAVLHLTPERLDGVLLYRLTGWGTKPIQTSRTGATQQGSVNTMLSHWSELGPMTPASETEASDLPGQAGRRPGDRDHRYRAHGTEGSSPAALATRRKSSGT